MTLPLIEFQGVRLAYRKGAYETDILSDVTFTLAQGKSLTFIGRSGAGKTTMLRLIAGLLEPTEGTVRVLGFKPRSLWRGQRIAYLTQRPILLPWKTIYENLELPQTINPRESALEIDAILQDLSLKHAANKRPSELSGGMLQRAMLGAALAMQPELLLLDEPFSALDEVTRREILKLVMEIRKKRSCNVVMVTHNLDDAIEISDHIGIIDVRSKRVTIHQNRAGDRPLLTKELLMEMLA